jgi:putative Mg2+ transporter-C (MgtC) family protein
MPIHPKWSDLAVRLLCAALAGFLIGFERGEHGRPAGLRTTMLVSLAACVSMMQANLLLGVAGKAPDSFVVLDLMRLPLGILSGMGFIGAGAIVRRDNLVLGITTAATLWFVTVLGLCFGGGQIVLGLAGMALAVAVTAGLRNFEASIKQERRARRAELYASFLFPGIPDGAPKVNVSGELARPNVRRRYSRAGASAARSRGRSQGVLGTPIALSAGEAARDVSRRCPGNMRLLLLLAFNPMGLDSLSENL